MADGLTLRLEGGIGLNFGSPVGIFSIVRDAPATLTSPLNFEPGMSRGPLSLAYRAEANWDFALGTGTKLRLGGIAAGYSGSEHETTPIYSYIVARPGGQDPALTEAEIVVCAGQTFPDACATFDGDLDRSYREVMPQLMLGHETAANGMIWYGLQAFSGSLSESTASHIERLPPLKPFPSTTVTDLNADTQGVMLAFEQERPLASGMKLLFGGGLGAYQMDATGYSDYLQAAGHRKDVTADIDGVRAQVMIGVEKPLSDRLSIGATLRADHWSDQPRIKQDWINAPCNPSICSPPARDGNFDIETDPFATISVGLSLTLRM